MQDAIGMIETIGLIAAVEGLDAALKSANVHLLGAKKVGGGIVTVILTGDVAAVRAAVEDGAAAAERVGKLRTKHVIARLHPEVSQKVILAPDKKEMKKDAAPAFSQTAAGGAAQAVSQEPPQKQAGAISPQQENFQTPKDNGAAKLWDMTNAQLRDFIQARGQEPPKAAKKDELVTLAASLADKGPV